MGRARVDRGFAGASARLTRFIFLRARGRSLRFGAYWAPSPFVGVAVREFSRSESERMKCIRCSTPASHHPSDLRAARKRCHRRSILVAGPPGRSASSTVSCRSRCRHGARALQTSGPIRSRRWLRCDDAVCIGKVSRRVSCRSGRARSCPFQSTGEPSDGLRQPAARHDLPGTRASDRKHIRLRREAHTVPRLRFGIAVRASEAVLRRQSGCSRQQDPAAASGNAGVPSPHPCTGRSR